jgi:chromosomal replication initiator protein
VQQTSPSPTASVWQSIAEALQQRIAATDYLSWFANAEIVEMDGSVCTLALANQFACDWVKGRFAQALTEATRTVLGPEASVRVIARVGSEDPNEDEVAPLELRAEAAVSVPSSRSTPAATLPQNELNDRYRFDTFVIGEANQLAHAAALSVAEAPGQAYNPLFIHGGTGLGKTHLLHAVGHYAMATQPGVRVAYVTTENFINRFIQAIQRKDSGRDRFKEYFRGIDILLMDDVQFLSGKSAAFQEELFHTFNALHDAGKQIVLTSDREPGAIPQLEERLQSRFAWGLTTDITTPGRETRIAILYKKAHADGLNVPFDVLSLVGERISSNIRELEGALTRIVGYASLTGQAITVDMAHRVLDAYVATGDAEPVTIDRIQQLVCEHFEVSKDDLLGPRRSTDVVRPRQIGMYLARVLLGAPSTQVAKRFGRGDHTTVLYAEKKVEQMIKEDREVYDLVEQLVATLRSNAAPSAARIRTHG